MPNRIKQNLFLGLCYIALSLIIGECHPFSLVSMYDSFPKTACTFYLSDNVGNLMPLQNYFDYKTADLTHNYYAICDKKKIAGGNETETQEQLHEIGKDMLNPLIQQLLIKEIPKKIQIHQVYYFLKNDSICSKEKMMYELESN
jgi:hypothetical protein